MRGGLILKWGNGKPSPSRKEKRKKRKTTYGKKERERETNIEKTAGKEITFAKLLVNSI